MLRPRHSTRRPESAGQPEFLAHRGGSGGPENTLVAYQAAHELGFGLEGDIQVTKDGVLVVSHDDSGLRMTGQDALIAHHTLAEIRRWDAGYGWTSPSGERSFAGQGITIPTLDEVLDAFPRSQWSFDIKPIQPSIVAQVVRMLRDRQMESQTILASFSARTLLEVRARGYRGRTSLAIRELYATFVPTLFKLLPLRGDIASLPLEHDGTFYGTDVNVRRAHACGLQVHFWGVNDLDEARRLIDLGVDILETDRPEILAPLLDTPR